MNKIITSALAIAAFAGFAGRMEAHDHGCGGHFGGGHFCGGGHFGGCSSFGLSLGVPLYYSSPAYYGGYYPSYGYGYGYPRYYSGGYGGGYGYSRYYSGGYGYYQGGGGSTSTLDVQDALARRGYYYGAIDGIIGAQSRNAIRRYQIDHGLPVTGGIDYPLLRSLGI